MVDKHSALRILGHEKDYEDNLVSDLNFYFISCLEDIYGLSDYEKDRIRQDLNVIIHDSSRHSNQFTQLQEYVLNNGKDNL